jgi:hypothetical protein
VSASATLEDYNDFWPIDPHDTGFAIVRTEEGFVFRGTKRLPDGVWVDWSNWQHDEAFPLRESLEDIACVAATKVCRLLRREKSYI